MTSIRTPSKLGAAVVLSAIMLSVLSAPAAYAATVSATGTNPSICNQSVSDATNVTAVRLSGGDCVITFLSGSVTWDAPSNLFSAEILVVGGGGGGGGAYNTAGAGGGGGGQVINETLSVNSGQSYLISVGAAGIAGVQSGATNDPGTIGGPGGNSSISLSGNAIRTSLGGRGGSGSRLNTDGYANAVYDRVGGAAASGSTAAGGGGRGGAGNSGGGGGGALGAGTAASGATPGSGGNGAALSITGSSVTYGTGGAGGSYAGTSSSGSAGATNSGGGGGGATASGTINKNGSAGGSGLVVFRYNPTPALMSELGLSGNVTQAVYRSTTTVSVKVSSPARVTFYLNGKKMAGCISIQTTGSSTNNIASCSWKPSVKGSFKITANARPVSPGVISSVDSALQITVSPRIGQR